MNNYIDINKKKSHLHIWNKWDIVFLGGLYLIIGITSLWVAVCFSDMGNLLHPTVGVTCFVGCIAFSCIGTTSLIEMIYTTYVVMKRIKNQEEWDDN